MTAGTKYFISAALVKIKSAIYGIFAPQAFLLPAEVPVQAFDL